MNLPIQKTNSNRSQSLPIIFSNKKLHSPNNKNKKDQKLDQILVNKPKLIQLKELNNKQEEELQNKLKIIAERSLKKLQQRYQTIDRWKQKYLSNIYKKNKKTSNQITNQQDQLLFKSKQIKKSICFPLLKKKCINPTFPDHGDRVKKVQAQLLARLQKNKKYYELKNSMIEHEINNFEQSQQFIGPDKKRQLQLKKLFLKLQKDNLSPNSILYQKANIIAQNLVQQTIVKSKPKYKQKIIKPIKTNNQIVPQNKDKIKRSQSIQQLKVKLIQQTSEHIPIGWQLQNDFLCQQTINQKDIMQQY